MYTDLATGFEAVMTAHVFTEVTTAGSYACLI